MQNPISHNLARLRVASGLSQRQLAALSGVNYSLIAKIEMGVTRHPRTDTLQKLQSALGATFNDLYQIQTPPDGEPNQSQTTATEEATKTL
jgi:transcriptional regulator with XRE-family HTH domain